MCNWKTLLRFSIPESEEKEDGLGAVYSGLVNCSRFGFGTIRVCACALFVTFVRYVSCVRGIVWSHCVRPRIYNVLPYCIKRFALGVDD